MRILRQPPATYDWKPVRMAIVTGLSNPNSCSLSEDQRSLLTAVSDDENSAVLWNFPFIPDSVPRTEMSLVQASMANGLQFLRSRTTGYQQLATPHWDALAEATGCLLIVTGSCGIQLLSCWPGAMQRAAAGRIRALALGPVGSSHPDFPVTLVQGSQDWISRLWFRKSDHVVNSVNHLDYWKNTESREIVLRWLRDSISELSARPVYCRNIS